MEVPSIFLNRILAESAKKNASSLHLSVGSIPTIRDNGELFIMEGESIITADFINKITDSFIDDKEKQKLEENKEIVLVKEFAGNFRFRVNAFYQKKLLSLSFHFIPNSVKDLNSLGLPDVLHNLVKLNSGLFIIAGSKFSGKTTTISVLIEEINKNYKKRIVTIEDPIEHLFVSKKSIIEQRQIGQDVKSLLSGIQYCFEEDVDIVYIGEIRERFDEAMPLILDLASGNSLVIMEINSNTSVRVIEKILNPIKTKMGAEVARYNLADVLVGIVVQELVPRLGGGMVLANEVMTVNPAIKSLIRDGKIYHIDSIIQTSKKEGMITMNKSKEELIRSGEIKQRDVKFKM